MSSPEPEKIPLLFPDSVIEYYVQRADRAAIRKRLKLTPEERLQALQREVNARAAQQAMRVREEWPDEAAPAMRFYDEEFQPPPSKIPIFPDPVIETYMKEVDRTSTAVADRNGTFLGRSSKRSAAKKRWLRFSEIRPAHGFNLRCIKLDKLIEIKRASGRTKDFEGIAELEIIRQEQTRP